MKIKKISGKTFPGGISKIIPKNPPEKKTKFMSDKERMRLFKRIDHYEKTKDLPTL